MTMAEGPLFAYRELIARGRISADPVQALAMEKLQSLHRALAGYSVATAGDTLLEDWKARLGLGRRRTPPPQGLYLYGGVGRGKSMLMDMFFTQAPMAEKRRVHFHEFMLSVHEAVHRRRQDHPGETDPLIHVAADVAHEARLLCFDEFHVADIADAMIMSRLFEALFAHGTVMVATSNQAPDDLYKDGLQREHFLPFIAVLKQKLDILHLDSPTDYRRRQLQNMGSFHSPLGSHARAMLERAFDELTLGAETGPGRLSVRGRSIAIARAGRGVAFLDFAELCEKPRGAEDYLALARACHTLIIDGVPLLTAARRNAARRFIILIDALYEARCKLIMAAEAPPDSLTPPGDHALSFARTSSRLMEMQSAAWQAESHRRGPDGASAIRITPQAKH